MKGPTSSSILALIARNSEIVTSSGRGGASESVSSEQLEQFPYVAAVISEAMRMWPPVTPFIGLQVWRHSPRVTVGRDSPLRAFLCVSINPRGSTDASVLRPFEGAGLDRQLS